MKRVQASIRPSSFHAVMKALDRLDVGGITVSDVSTCGTPGFRGSYRGGTYVVDELPMIRVEVVAADAYAGPIAWAIATAARTGHPDDGVVSVETVEEARRILTGEQGIAAVSARLETAEAALAGVELREGTALPDRTGMSDATKVLLTNVTLTTVFVVVVLHAQAGYAALGAGSAGLLLWARERWARRMR